MRYDGTVESPFRICEVEVTLRTILQGLRQLIISHSLVMTHQQ